MNEASQWTNDGSSTDSETNFNNQAHHGWIKGKHYGWTKNGKSDGTTPPGQSNNNENGNGNGNGKGNGNGNGNGKN